LGASSVDEVGRTMADDRSYIHANTRERERLRALIEELHDDDDRLSEKGPRP
jgi:hypothetical protein